MNIVILDAHTTNPGDLSWEPITKLGHCRVYARTSAKQVLSRSKDADIIINNKVIFDKQLLSQLPRLKYLGIIATGYNVVDLVEARKRNIPVTHVPNYSTASVAQLVFAFILEHFNHLAHHDRTVKRGKWVRSRDFCYWDYPQIELEEKILGIYGCGNIGKTVARIGFAFGMKVMAYDTCKPPLENLPIQMVEADLLFRQSDILTLHCPLNEKTLGLINQKTLAMMRPTAFLINTSRGPIVNEKDLAGALNNGIIAGAGVDVLSTEPPAADNPMLTAKNCLITPHVGWAGRESRKRLIQITADNVKAFLEGDPINVVN